MLPPEDSITTERISTGIPGFDEVVAGGLLPGRTYLVSGPPGTGKTTLGWHFLTAGTARGEEALYVTFAEPEAELRANAARSGFDVSKVRIVDLSPAADVFTRSETYDLFSAREVEREPTTSRIVEAVESCKPVRVFVDSMTSLRFLTTDAFQFRRQALSFLRYLAAHDATVLLTSESTKDTPDDDLRFIVDGVIELALEARTWTLRVTKFRGSSFRNGAHGMRLGPTGVSVFPRLLPEDHRAVPTFERFSTGVERLDDMLHGGLERGTVTLISGPTGVGKSTLGITLLSSLAKHGVSAAMYTFDERAETLIRRCGGIGLPVREQIAQGTLVVREIEALRYGPDEFASIVRDDVETRGTQVVAIDSVSGYRMTIQGGDVNERIHALGRYFQNVGITFVLIDELRDLMTFRVSDLGVSYLADNAIYLRFVERMNGEGVELRKGIGVLKKRLGDFDKTVREFSITERGIVVGDTLRLNSMFAPLPVDERLEVAR